MTITNPTTPAYQRPGSGRPGPASTPSPSLDPFRVLRKHLTAVIASCVFGVILGVGVWGALWFLYPFYTTSDHYEIIANIAEADQVTTDQFDREDVVVRVAKTEMAYLMSRAVLGRAMTNQDVLSTEWANAYTDRAGNFMTEDAVDALLEEISVRYVPDTNLFEVSWSAQTASDIIVILKAVREAYLRYRDQIDNSQFDTDLAVFAQQETEINAAIDSLTASTRDFVQKYKVFTLEDIRNHPVAMELTALNQSMASNRAGLSMLQTQRSQIQAKLLGQLDPSEEDRLAAENTGEIASIYNTINALEIQRSVRVEKFGAEHSAVKEIDIQIASARDYLETRIQEIIQRNLTGAIKAIDNSIQGLNDLYAQLKADADARNAVLTEIGARVSEYESLILRRAGLMEDLHNVRLLINDLHRVRLRTAADRVRVATVGETPREKSFPRPEIMIPLGFLVVVGLTVGVIFLREITDKRVKSASDLAIVPGARVLGVIPDLQEDPTRIERAEMAVRQHPRSVTAESYRQACTPIAKLMERSGHQSLVVVGGLPGSGSTTVVSNIAAFFAAGGKSVLCIDANFRRPGLARAMGCENADGKGLADVLAGEAYLTDAIQGCGSGIHVVSAGTAANRTFERLGNGQFEQILAEVRPQYDFIVIDAPPAVVAGDAMVLANRTDASLLVVRANQEHRGLVAKLIGQFSEAQSELLGVVLNRPRGTAGGYFKKNFAAMAEYAAKS